MCIIKTYVSVIALWGLALAGSSALAGFDVSMSDKSIEIISADGQPIPNSEIWLKAEASHKTFGLCGERPPYPGFCWHWDLFQSQTFLSDIAGRVKVPSQRFQTTSSSWGDDLIVALNLRGILVPQCRPRGSENYYTLVMDSQCYMVVYSKSDNQIVDRTQAPGLTCRLQENALEVERKIQEALSLCDRR